jgi:HEAT repeat protein/Na+/melibiose symporter-like transporter
MMSNEPTTLEKLRGLPWSIATNATNTVFSQFTFFGTVFILFLNTLGLTKTEIGFVLAFIPFSALLAPFVAPFTARMGYKRAFVIFYALRKVAAALLLLTPWVLYMTTQRVTFLYVAAVVALFAVVRTIEETAYYPWVQEFVPNNVRGKYSASSNVVTASVGFVAISVAGFVLEQSTSLYAFNLLFGTGILFGLISVWSSTFIPGGARPSGEAGAEAPARGITAAIHDVEFRRYLWGTALIVLGTVPLASFLPLYMEERVGLSAGSIVVLQVGTMFGALLSGYLWGWAADRYGSKPVMLIGLGLMAAVPLLFWLTPLVAPFSLAYALVVSFLQGIANLGWGIGAGRLLFVTIVPPENKMDYMALYFAWVGIIAGASQLAGGAMLDGAQQLADLLQTVVFDAYWLLFLLSIVLSLASAVVLRNSKSDGTISTREFAGIFLRGNPFLAMSSMIRFYRTRDEHDAVAVTERMGEIRSKLTVDELLSALQDPRFAVRFEAVLAIARMPAEPRLRSALVKILNGRSPALSTIAAYALGRVADPESFDALRDGLNAPYRSVRAHCARALGTIGDHASVPVLLEHLRAESDGGLRIAYLSSLAKLGVVEVVPDILQTLAQSDEESERAELALALARICGKEQRYVQLYRDATEQFGTVMAGRAGDVHKRISRLGVAAAEAAATLQVLEDQLAREQLDAGAQTLAGLIERVPADGWHGSCREIAKACTVMLRAEGATRREYFILALHALDTGWIGTRGH